MNPNPSLLARLAEEAMVKHGFLPHPPPEALAEANARQAATTADGARDLCGLAWTSIDNPESRDLDQIEAVEKADGGIKLYVGIADVERYVPVGSANDGFAAHNTTSVYTGVRTFPMLPERFSFDLTSLVADQKRFAVVIETLISPEGEVKNGKVYAALVLNRAKLDYPSVSAWLDGKAAAPARLAASPELSAQIKLQDELARILAAARKRAGALDVETSELRLVADEHGGVRELKAHQQDRAGGIIEELMIASNQAVAADLDARGRPSIRRVVKEPEHWDRIVAYARERGGKLPAAPSVLELSRFVEAMRSARPAQFAEISLALIKMIGRGEYVAHLPGAAEVGHFGLATQRYTHATAPNRRYIDLVMQRIVKGSRPYTATELSVIAARCTQFESEAQKVERQVHKSAAALLIRSRVGESFDGIVTGAGDKGTFVRVVDPPVEGKIIMGERGLKVGDKARVRLHDVNVEKGFIDFQIV